METNESAKWLKRIFILLCFPLIIGSILLTVTIVENISYMLDDSTSIFDTTKIIAAKGDLSEGDELTDLSVGLISVQYDELPENYIRAADYPALRGHIITKPISNKAPLTWFHTDVVLPDVVEKMNQLENTP